MGSHKKKQKVRYRAQSNMARSGSFCLMGQILLLIGGPRLVAVLWRFR